MRRDKAAVRDTWGDFQVRKLEKLEPTVVIIIWSFESLDSSRGSRLRFRPLLKTNEGRKYEQRDPATSSFPGREGFIISCSSALTKPP